MLEDLAQLWVSQLLLLGHHSSSCRSPWGRRDKRLHSYVTGLEPVTCQLGGSAKLALWLGFLENSWASVCALRTSQGRVRTAVGPFPWNGSCQGIRGLLDSSIPAFLPLLFLVLPGGPFSGMKTPCPMEPDAFMSHPKLPIPPQGPGTFCYWTA